MVKQPFSNYRMIFLCSLVVLIGISAQVGLSDHVATAAWDISYSKKWGSTCLLASMIGCVNPNSLQAEPDNIGNGQFWGLWGIASDDSAVYALDVLNHRVQKFDFDGNFINKWGSKGTGDGQFTFPSGIAVDLQYVYVIDHGNRIQVFNKDGEFLKAMGGGGITPGMFNTPEDIDVDYTGHIYVADSGNKRIQVLSLDNSTNIDWGSQGTGRGQFEYPQGISVPAPGHVYVTDSLNDRIQYFELGNTCRAGTTQIKPGVCFVKEWGRHGLGDGEFQRPTDIDVSGPIVYVTDSNNNRIQLFTTDGTFLTKFGSECLIKTGLKPSVGCIDPDGIGPLMVGDGQFKYPSGISAIANAIFVADNYNDRVQKLNVSIGTFPLAVPLVANAGEDQTVDSGQKVRLNGEGSKPDDGSLKFFWRQTGGSQNVDLTDPDSAIPTFDTSQVTQDTVLNFELEVTDKNGRVDTDTVSVKVVGQQQNQKPQANAGEDKTVLEGGSTDLDGTSSKDKDGTIKSYQWHAIGCDNNEPKGTIQGSSDARATFVAPQISADSTACKVELKVTDNDGATDSDTVQVTVKNAELKTGQSTTGP